MADIMDDSKRIYGYRNPNYTDTAYMVFHSKQKAKRDTLKEVDTSIHAPHWTLKEPYGPMSELEYHKHGELDII
jgi:hypothetical protein